MDAADGVFEQAEEPVDGLGVRVALDVDARRVADPPMCVAGPAEPLVGRVLVCGVSSRREDLLGMAEEA